MFEYTELESFENFYFISEQVDKLENLSKKLEEESIGEIEILNEKYNAYSLSIKRASEEIINNALALFYRLKVFYENESDMLERNLTYLFDKIDDSEDFYIKLFPNREHRYNEQFIADYLVYLLEQADKRETPQGYNHNSAISYVRQLINIDYNNFKKGLPSVLDLTANGVEFNNKPYVDHKKTHVNE